jgi:hypothetical protein
VIAALPVRDQAKGTKLAHGWLRGEVTMIFFKTEGRIGKEFIAAV